MSNALVYAPIKEWDNDDVWLFLMEKTNPWGIKNKDLFDMYRGATQDKECPLVIDTSTQVVVAVVLVVGSVHL